MYGLLVDCFKRNDRSSKGGTSTINKRRYKVFRIRRTALANGCMKFLFSKPPIGIPFVKLVGVIGGRLLETKKPYKVRIN